MKYFTLSLALVAASSAAAANVHDAQRAAAIDAINAMPGLTWTAGANPRFKGTPVGSAAELCGVNMEEQVGGLRVAIAQGKVEAETRALTPAEVAALPDSFDSVAHWPQCAKVIGDIRDQSACGCCWAFGGAEAASDRLCISTNAKVAVPLSAQELCFCANDNGCGGGMLQAAWSYVQNNGLVTGGQNDGIGPFGNSSGFCSEFSLPHCHHHGPVGHGGDHWPSEGTPGCPSVSQSPSCPTECDAGAKAPYADFNKARYSFNGGITSYYPNEANIRAGIFAGGPVEAAFTVYQDFENYVGGIYTQTSYTQLGGHAIRIVGWGEEGGVKYWKVANSWNPMWGEKGYFRIRRGTNECGIEQSAMSSSTLAKWSGPGIN